jgi:hypothetical protein
MEEVVSDRVIDPLMLVVTLGVFFSFWLLLPKLGLLLIALLTSLISAVTFATFIAGSVPNMPFEVDALFARFVSALIQCGIAAGAIWTWRRLRN